LFRLAMSDLQLVGEEPRWEQMDLLDRIDQRELLAPGSHADPVA